VAEWSNAAVSKTVVRRKSDPGFKSQPLRHFKEMMKKIKIIYICLFIPFFIFVALTVLKIKNKEEFQQKAVLAREIRKVLYHLMVDLRDARVNTFLDAPADGQWHNRIAFIEAGQGALEYVIKEGHLLRLNDGKSLLIADDIGGLRIRHQKETPDIVEVQIEARKNVSLTSYLKIRIRE
jgi:hypothetical protein